MRNSALESVGNPSCGCYESTHPGLGCRRRRGSWLVEKQSQDLGSEKSPLLSVPSHGAVRQAEITCFAKSGHFARLREMDMTPSVQHIYWVHLLCSHEGNPELINQLIVLSFSSLSLCGYLEHDSNFIR
jgi:hypothetical protein